MLLNGQPCQGLVPLREAVGGANEEQRDREWGPEGLCEARLGSSSQQNPLPCFLATLGGLTWIQPVSQTPASRLSSSW